MGRSSAGGGGGRSSGGSSFRSSSGHRSSGAGRSSRGTQGSGFGGGFGGRPFHGGADPFVRPGGYRPHRLYGYERRSFLGSGFLIGFILIIWVLAALFINTGSGTGSQEIQVSSVEREKLPDSMTTETAYYQDDLGWIGNSYQLEKGMQYFYQKTGVFPYLWITDNVDGNSWPSDETIDAKLEEMYTELFTDEGHAIVMYLDAGNGNYITRCLRGASAKTVLDAEATEILLDYLDAYATSDLDDETYFSTCFTKAADRMMSRTTNSGDVMKTLILAVAVVLFVVAIIVFLLQRRKMKLEQAKIDQEILNTKL